MNAIPPPGGPRRETVPPAEASHGPLSTVRESEVHAERVRLLYRSPLPALANPAVASLLAIAAWGEVHAALLLGWLAAMTMATAIRIGLWKAFHARPRSIADAGIWERRLVANVAVSGAVWALTGLAIGTGGLSADLEAMVAIAAGGMIAGAMFSLTASMPAFRFYAVPVALGPALGFMAHGDRDHLAVGGMGLVYLVVVLMWGRDAWRAADGSIRLRLENQALLADLIVAREVAEAADRIKRESFANLGHELRTPLNAIIGFAQTMESELWGPLGDSRYRDYTRAIAHSGQHLYGLILDILDLTRHDAGVLELEEGEVDLAATVRTCCDMLAGSATAGGVTVRVEAEESGPWVIGDATKLRQIVINLLANAIRFTPPDGRVVIGVRRLDGGETELRIEDTGVGLEPEDIPRALEPFVQVVRHGRERGAGGIGLGLPLSKRLAERHDGRLEIESRLGEGTVVRVVLPASRASDGPSRTQT